MRFLLFLTSVVVIMACSRRSSTAVVVPPQEVDLAADTAIAILTDSVADVALPPPQKPRVIFSMQRGGCYGRCPEYRFEIYSDGMAYYTGAAHVTRLGEWQLESSEPVYERIRSRLQLADFYTLSNQYPEGGMQIESLPVTTIYSYHDGRAKTVVNWYDAPPRLIELQRELERLIDGQLWTPIVPKS